MANKIKGSNKPTSFKNWIYSKYPNISNFETINNESTNFEMKYGESS